jgi:NAD(P)H-nitrite reductase large subunit
VAVLGAGLVSLQTASAVARPGLSVTCAVGSRQILSQNIDAECAKIVQEHVEREGHIEFLFGRGVAGVERRDDRSGERFLLSLSSGEELDADMVVVGKGVTPNLDFVDRDRIAVDRGILVDEHLRTTTPNVFAAGDVAQGRNRITGDLELVANWIDACEQGRVAGLNMAGREVAYPGSVPENVTTLFGLPVASIGLARPGDECAAVTEVVGPTRRAGAYRKVITRDDVPVGAIVLGDIRDVGVLRNRIVRADGAGRDAEDLASRALDFAGRVRSCVSPCPSSTGAA